jgi:hypothetical protein
MNQASGDGRVSLGCSKPEYLVACAVYKVGPFKRIRVNIPDADRCAVVRVRIRVNPADV